MERFIHDQNMKLYRQKLADPDLSEAEREKVAKLLAEEEAKAIGAPTIPLEKQS